MKKIVFLLPLLLTIIMGFVQVQPNVFPPIPITEQALLGEWKLEKVESYDVNNSLKNTITTSNKETIIRLSPQNKITVIENSLINEQGISDQHKWYLKNSYLLLKRTDIEIPLKINSLTQKSTVLEMINPKATDREYKALIYLTKIK
ncbi:hypothetical protein [Myroides sp. N17-2]|uniref:hypothetical protein n=1 Tax=Myroides sp. N17-2 TaxID=2030799 RepID=UPI000EFD11B3|nr:hypothetical protein [Myroides sp. N17-2]